jgi:NAD(P)H-hydrate epimerase
MWIATADRSREIDRRASDEFGLPARVLMERAGLAVFDAIHALLPQGGSIAIVCGKGNNGGDGFVTARTAKDRGYRVEVLVAAPESDLTNLATEQMNIARAQGITPIFADDARWARYLETLTHKELIVDALLGTGAKCEVRGHIREAIQAINRSGVPVVAVDLPSGICANTGEELGESVWALRTITFGLPKPFLFQGTGLEHAGYWSVAEIGYPQALLNEETHAKLIDSDWVAHFLPERMRASHKGDNGSILIVAGSQSMPGAASLVALAALRAGAGLVTVAAPESVCRSVSINVPEALLMELPSVEGVLHVDAADQLEIHQDRFDSAIFGPGLSQESSVVDTLSETWRNWRIPTVIDADAINAVAQGVPLPQAPCVLTPHPGEMSRLLHASVAEIQSDRFRTVVHAVQRTLQCVLLKGPYSIVGEPNQPMLVNSSGNPGMAAAGMGDVLSGIIGTLLAQELPPYLASACGMFWHGLAADQCANAIGPTGFLASDVANRLPKARATITMACHTESTS